jgi:nucleoside-diphosphate-sugar epimerase|tara:strand:+ start:7627 stop:8628 length:1002 start_codon:yes stop_codon:yes gene_type:complete
MRKALITGGCGFIGSNLTKKLVEQGWQVDIIDDMSNGHLELLEGLNIRVLINGSFYTAYMNQEKQRLQDEVLVVQDDFSNDHILNSVYKGNYDVIFHQAAVPRVSYSVEEPFHTTDVNISKTVRLFEAARGSVDRIVWASSSSVYGGAETFPIDESVDKNPKSPYAWQKSSIEEFAKLCWQLYKLDIVCLRYFNVFGPGQYGDSPYSTAVSAWCHATKNNLTCRSDGDGSQSRDMCYIDNTVSANILAAEAKGPFAGERYNIACNARTTNKEILDHFVSEFGSKVEHAPWRQGDVMHTQADISKAKLAFGYEPLVSFWEGLERTVQWWGLRDG